MPYSNAHIVLNSRDATGGSYNNSKYNAVNQNIIQGNIADIAVSELNFPYDIPNIQPGPKGGDAGSTNVFYLSLLNGPATLRIVLPTGFYTGDELATNINTAIQAAAAAAGFPTPAVNTPLCAYSGSSNTFAFGAPTAPSAPIYAGPWEFISPYTFPVGAPAGSTSTLGKDIMSLMGFQSGQSASYGGGATAFPFISAQSAPMAFTQYIDVCSPQLCKFQYFRDGSTTNLARRSDVICRLYIANEISVQSPDPEGVRPFIIHRQFMNARVMKWTADNAVGTIDIQLYDDCGQPLATAWVPRPYQITFNAYEIGDDDDLVADAREAGIMEKADGPPRHGAYTNKNAKAWQNLHRNQ